MTEQQQSIVNVFTEWFGEERIDIKEFGANDEMIIYVWYPEADITNEDGETIHIKDLYFRFFIKPSGKLVEKPTALRTTFNKAQYLQNYYHSHVNSHDMYNEWCLICTGVSPFTNTLTEVICSYDINAWNFIPSQLDDFVRTESLEGVPYQKMRNVRTTHSTDSTNIISSDCLNPSYNYGEVLTKTQLYHIYRFLMYLSVNNDYIKIDYIGDDIEFHDTDIHLLNNMSKAFLAYLKRVSKKDKKELESMLMPVIYNGRDIYMQGRMYNDFHTHHDITFVFKDEAKHIVIEDDNQTEEQLYYLLKPGYVQIICDYIRIIFNNFLPRKFDLSKPIKYAK